MIPTESTEDRYKILEYLWDRGKCRTVPSDVFYPDVGHDAKRAKMLCAECPVGRMCKEYAIVAEAHGVWGGLTERERRKERRRRELPEPGAIVGLVPYNVVVAFVFGRVDMVGA